MIMTETIAAKLQTLGHILPAAPAPAANYVPVVRTGDLLFISGKISRVDEQHAVFGTMGAELSVDDDRRAATPARPSEPALCRVVSPSRSTP
jgi:hypothetical protein